MTGFVVQGHVYGLLVNSTQTDLLLIQKLVKYCYHDHNNDDFNALQAEFTQLQTKHNTTMTFYWFILVKVNAWQLFLRTATCGHFFQINTIIIYFQTIV